MNHTFEKKSFTWDPKKFTEPDREKMYNETRKRGRKLVVIVDPHISQSENYVINDIKQYSNYETTKREEHPGLKSLGHYLVNAPGGKVPLTGKGWPGSSVWLDFFQEKVRLFWGALFSTKNKDFNLPIDLVHGWIDMNEPAILDFLEGNLSKRL